LWLLLALVVTQAAAPADFDVSTLTLSTQTRVAELDLGKLQGDIRQLAWSDDAAHVYVMTTDRRDSSSAARHYVVTIAGGAIERVARQPQWAIDYWSYKSDRFAPGRASVQKGTLPAWSVDGTTLAFLAKSGRKTYVLSVIGVSRRQPGDR